MIPLACLKSEIFINLLRIAEEEFGLASSGPIMLPCNSNFMEYALTMIQKGVAKDVEKALIMSLASCSYSSLSQNHHEQTKPQFIVVFREQIHCNLLCFTKYIVNFCQKMNEILQ